MDAGLECETVTPDGDVLRGDEPSPQGPGRRDQYRTGTDLKNHRLQSVSLVVDLLVIYRPRPAHAQITVAAVVATVVDGVGAVEGLLKEFGGIGGVRDRARLPPLDSVGAGVLNLD